MCQGWHAGHSAVTSQACSSSPTGSMVAPPIVGFMGLGNMGIGACRKHLCTCKPSTMPATMTHCHRCACRLSKQHTALPERARGPRRVLWQAARAQPYAGKSKAGAGPWRLPQSNRQRCAAAPALLPNKPSPQFLLFHTCCNCCWPSVRAPRRCTWRSAAWRLNDSLAWTILWLVCLHRPGPVVQHSIRDALRRRRAGGHLWRVPGDCPGWCASDERSWHMRAAVLSVLEGQALKGTLLEQ